MLKAPQEYYDLTPSQKADICNGCGPKGWGWLVPDRFQWMGFDLTEACNIHDLCYHIGMPKKEADNLFWENGSTMAEKAHFGLRSICDRLAFLYYLAVKNGGAGSYNRAKNGN